MDKAECKDQYSEPETEGHLNGKRDLYEWICQQENVKNAVLEGWIPETKQRPDIMFEYNNRKYVIEYQCSPIASEYLERHELYKTAGIHDIWICGTEKYLGSNKRLNTLEKNTGIYYNSTHKLLYVLEPLSEKEFKEINKMISLRDDLSTYYKQIKYFNRTFHVMKNNFDFQNAYKNYIHIKNSLIIMLKVGDKEVQSTKVTYEDLVILYNQYVVVMALVSLFNAITDPTTKGIGDSTNALTYSEPKR